MTQVRSSRPVSLGLTALIAFASALVALAAAVGPAKHAQARHGEPAASANGAVTSRVCAPAGNAEPLGGSRELDEARDHQPHHQFADTKATVARLLRDPVRHR